MRGRRARGVRRAGGDGDGFDLDAVTAAEVAESARSVFRSIALFVNIAYANEDHLRLSMQKLAADTNMSKNTPHEFMGHARERGTNIKKTPRQQNEVKGLPLGRSSGQISPTHCSL